MSTRRNHLDGGAQVLISGKSGVATKTSWGTDARSGSDDRAVVFAVKGSDLCLIDKPNNRFHLADETGAVAMQEPSYEPVPENSVRDQNETHAYGWSPARFIEAGLLEYVFDDLESGQQAFTEQVVRLQLLRWAWPLRGDYQGRIVLSDRERQFNDIPSTWEPAYRDFCTNKQAGLSARQGHVVEDLDSLVEFVVEKLNHDCYGFDSSWTGGVTKPTIQAFLRRLWKAAPRLGRLIRAGLTEVDLSAQVSVVDVHALHADAQKFVIAAVLAHVWSQHEHSTAPGKTFVVLDELNKYAPRY